MREAIGGTWILGVVIVFIVMFSGYLAISVNYTKAFKVKNRIINIIEESEGYTTNNGNNGKKRSLSEIKYIKSINGRLFANEKIALFLDEIGYKYKLDDSECTKLDRNLGTMYDGSYCIKKITSEQGGSYYKVTSFIKFEIPIIYANFTIPISGETKVIYNTLDDL